MRGWKRLIIIAIFAALVGSWSGAPANAQTLEFYQLDFDLDGTITVNSDWGTVNLTFTGSPEILYFNLAVDGSWQVQNIPVLSIEGAGVTQTLSLWFDLGNDVGTDVTSLYYASELTTYTLESPPTGSTLASVSDEWIVFYNGLADDPGGIVPPPAVPIVGGMVGGKCAVATCWNRGVFNQEAGHDECGPTAVSNSLRWLNVTHALGMTANATSIATMKTATNWGSKTVASAPGPGVDRVLVPYPAHLPTDPHTFNGCWAWHDDGAAPGERNSWWEDKKAYMEANDYPITTTTYNFTQIGQICGEMDRDQDVEMAVTGHLVTLVGMARLRNGNWYVVFKDDDDQGATGGRRKGASTYDPNQGKFIGGDLTGKWLFYFVVECPKKEFEFRMKKVFAYPGQQHVRVPVFLRNPDSVGGWEILMRYDPTAGTVVGVELCDSVFVDDPEHYGWHYAHWAYDPSLRPEYFNYTLNADGHEDWVRITAIMDLPWPQPHVPDIPPGQQQLLFCFTYDVSPLWSGREIMFDFLTRDCGDNVLSSSDGYTVWGPDTLSAPDWSCPQRPDSLKVVRLTGGAGIGIRTVTVGDINLNGMAYEIGDAILFVQYLILGTPVLIEPELQTSNSDINGDGVFWTVGDLVMLLNIINDVDESKSELFPKEPVELTLNGSKVTVRSDVELGAAYLILRCEGEIEPARLVLPEMELESSKKNGELKVLVYSMESKRIPAGSHILFTVPGATGLLLEKVEIADAYGNPLTVSVGHTTHPPTKFSLAQNSPNPLSMGTEISYALPKTSRIELAIYNVSGQRMRTLVNTEQEPGYYRVSWDARDDSGIDVASGVYFYRLEAGEFTSTRKMTLIR